MSEALRAALLFLVTTVFNLYLFMLIIRVILVWIGANYYEPVTQFIVKVTDFIVKPLRNLIPNYRGIEFSSLVIILALEIIKFLIISLLSFGFPNIFGLIILAIADSIKLLLEAFFYAILLQAILTWIQPGAPINYLLARFTAPIMNPIRRVIPPIAGVDISPIPALIILQLLIILIVNSLMGIGLGVAFA